MQELISVIVPIFNVEKYIGRCLESLIGQTYQNIEVICIDDGSTDSSGVIADEYSKKDDRIKVYHQEYYGVSDARNKGLEKAKGEYIVFLDSDDEADKDYVLKLYNILKDNDLDISQCSLIRVRDGKQVNRLEVKEGVRIFDGLQMQWKIFERNRYFTMCLCGKLFKRQLFEGLSFPVGRINEDESLIYLLMYRSKRVGVIDDYLYYYHYNSQSITEKKYNIHRLDSFYMLEEKFAFYREKGLIDLANKTANEYFSQMSVVFVNGKREASDYKAIKKKAKEFYNKDRKEILEKSKLTKTRWIFMKLSYISFSFVPLYGKILRKILEKRR